MQLTFEELEIPVRGVLYNNKTITMLFSVQVEVTAYRYTPPVYSDGEPELIIDEYKCSKGEVCLYKPEGVSTDWMDISDELAYSLFADHIGVDLIINRMLEKQHDLI